MNEKRLLPVLVAVTGASGALYAQRFLFHCKRLGLSTELIVTDAGRQVIAWEKQTDLYNYCSIQYRLDNWFSPPASGSAAYLGMVVLPCSMGTLAKIASGIADNLLTRAADVSIKERRPLVLVPREMPFSLLHLDNMEKLLHAGVSVVPACPHFYQHPQSIEALVDTVVAKVFDQLGIPHDLVPAWGRSPNEEASV